MTGTDYANLIASYVARRFGGRGLKVYREIRVGKSIIGKNRCIDVFCVREADNSAFAVECKYQESVGTVDEKIPYALDDLAALPIDLQELSAEGPTPWVIGKKGQPVELLPAARLPPRLGY